MSNLDEHVGVPPGDTSVGCYAATALNLVGRSLDLFLRHTELTHLMRTKLWISF